MSTKYSISQARDQLARLVHEAEEGRPIELTRRGEPVAVVLAIEEYRRLSSKRSSVWTAINQFRAAHDLSGMDEVVQELVEETRSSEPGREFSW
jgi:prevent-host-death family protein